MKKVRQGGELKLGKRRKMKEIRKGRKMKEI